MIEGGTCRVLKCENTVSVARIDFVIDTFLFDEKDTPVVFNLSRGENSHIDDKAKEDLHLWN